MRNVKRKIDLEKLPRMNILRTKKKKNLQNFIEILVCTCSHPEAITFQIMK